MSEPEPGGRSAMTTTTPRSRMLSMAMPLLLLAGASLRADDRYQRPGGGFGRIEGRPDREELLRGAVPYGPTRPVDTVGVRPYEQRAVTPVSAPAPPPRRSAAQYYPGLRSGQYTAHVPTVGHAHCTPSRGYLAGMR